MGKLVLILGVMCALINTIAGIPLESDSPLPPVVEKGHNEAPLLLTVTSDKKDQPTTLDVVDFDQSNNGEGRNDGMDASRARRTILLKKAALLKLGLLKAGVVGLGAAKFAGLGLAGSSYNNYYGPGRYGGYNGGYNNGGYIPYGYSSPYGRNFVGVASYGYY